MTWEERLDSLIAKLDANDGMQEETSARERTPEEIKDGLIGCSEDGCKGCPYEVDCMETDGFSECAKDALAYIKRLEEVVMLMVLQYCQDDGKLDHQFMCAGEQAFAVLGLKQYGPIEDLHKLMDEAGVI